MTRWTGDKHYKCDVYGKVSAQSGDYRKHFRAPADADNKLKKVVYLPA
jgi:hypothetical protein